MPHNILEIDQGVPHSSLDGNSKPSVYATAFRPSKSGFASCGGQVTSRLLDELVVLGVVNDKTPNTSLCWGFTGFALKGLSHRLVNLACNVVLPAAQAREASPGLLSKESRLPVSRR
jgi:hypothetical protein